MIKLLRIPTALILGLLFPVLSRAQPLPNAHAHNDYEHTHPLFDALKYGFTSVEADVHLVGGKLLVSHSYPIFKTKTLEELYLKPLDSIARVHSGKIYPDYNGTFYLMIDIKTDGAATYDALNKILTRYRSLLKGSGAVPPVTIFLSGNRPIDLVVHDPNALVSLDGRPGDVGKSYTSETMPVISDNYNQWSDWNGKGTGDLQKIAALARRVHAEGKRLRLWAIPDNPLAWRALLEAGVDVINTDHLAELSEFLRSRVKEVKGK